MVWLIAQVEEEQEGHFWSSALIVPDASSLVLDLLGLLADTEDSLQPRVDMVALALGVAWLSGCV